MMANYLPTVLEGSARSWLLNLPVGSIYTWEQLCDLLIANFQGTYDRPGKEDDLHRIRQNSNETLRQYIKRFSQVRNSIPEVAESSVIQAFKAGLRNRRFTEDIAMNPPRTTVELFDMADKYAAASEAVEWSEAIDRKDKIPQPGFDKSEKKQKKAFKKKKNRKSDDKEVLVVPEKFTKGKKDFTGRGKIKAPTDGYKSKKWCPLHQQAGHDLRTCRAWHKKLDDYYAGKAPLPSIQELGETSSKKDKDGDEEMAYQEPQHTIDRKSVV